MIAVSREQTGRSFRKQERDGHQWSSSEKVAKEIISTQSDESRPEGKEEMELGESSHHAVCNKAEPVLYEAEEFMRLTHDANSVVAELPRDFLRFDFTAMEDPLRRMVYC